jgi:hypothetical protein
MTVAPITPLLFRSGPAAIARFVISIPVRVSVQRRAMGPNSHIGKEVRERCPTFTHCDPATSVVSIGGVLGVPAPLMHGAPTHVRRACCQAMAQVPRLLARLILLAAAADRQTALEIGCIDPEFRTAGAPANPASFKPGPISCPGNNRKSSKDLTHQIIQLRHRK